MKPAARRHWPLGAPCCVAGAGAAVQGPAHVAAFTCVGCVQQRHARRLLAPPARCALRLALSVSSVRSVAPLRARLAAVLAAEEALRQRVEAALQPSLALAQQQAARRERTQRAQRVAARRAAALHQLERVVAASAQLKECNTARDAALRDAAAQLVEARTQTLQGGLPERLVSAQLQHRLVAQVLGAEKQRVIAQLRQALPLHWKRSSSDAGRAAPQSPDAPRFVRICGVVLPADADFTTGNLSAAEVSAGLGLMLHFTTLASRYLGAPLLCQGCYRGSTSTVWQRRSADDDGYDGGGLPLYASGAWDNAGGDAPGSGAGAAAGQLTTAAAVGSWARGLGRVMLEGVDASFVRDGGLASDAWAAPGPGAAQRQAGLRLLHRAVRQLCAHELHQAGAPPPPRWGPFALLAAVCAGLARPRSRDGAGGAVAAAYPEHAAPGLRVTTEEASDSDGEDWERIDALLPPPPSCPEDVALWERYTK